MKQLGLGCSGWMYDDWRGFAPANALALRRRSGD
jgi:uncharacterized protein YecE (DUF72 family)